MKPTQIFKTIGISTLIIGIFTAAFVSIILLNGGFQGHEVAKTQHTETPIADSIIDEAELESEPMIELEHVPDPEPEEIFTDIRIAATGDIMFHMPQIKSGYQASSQTYDFKSVFDDVKPFLSEADMAIANFETTLAGPERGYSGYPTFSAPDEVIDAIQHAGIDVLTTANNHSLDKGLDGLKRTVKLSKKKGSTRSVPMMKNLIQRCF